MLTAEDKDYLEGTYATKEDLKKFATKEDFNQLEIKFDNLEDRMARQLGAHLEAIDGKFQLLVEMIMAHIDKKFEQFQSHERRITKVERQSSFNRADIVTHNRRLKRLEL